jgi:hypothetical protein
VTDTDFVSAVPTQAPNGAANKRGGGLDQKFPWREVVHVDDDLHGAIELAANVEKERAAVVMRRWLRRSAMAEGYYKPAGA